MRRLLIGLVCLAAAGYAAWLLSGRRREQQWAEAAVAPPIASQPVAEVVPLPVREPDPAEPRAPVRESERRLHELVALRAEILAGVDRRALYTMAHDRGRPHHILFLMDSEQLLDAVLAAEELPPADVLPSVDTERRVRAIAAEAFSRHERFAAEDAASELDAG